MPSRPGAEIVVTGLTKTLGKVPVEILRGIDLHVSPGEFIAVTGASGSGKSTLLHIVAGLDQPTSGNVRIGGVDLATLSDDRLAIFRRTHIGLIFQAFHLLDILTAEENVAVPLALARVPTSESSRRAREMLEALGLGQRRRHRPDQLSGGEQQRVAIARALIGGPALLLADEPTGNLDSKARALVMGILRGAVDRMGVTLVMVTHDPVCAASADREVQMCDGQWVDASRRMQQAAYCDPVAPQPVPFARAA